MSQNGAGIMSQTGSNSFGDSTWNCDTVTRRQCLKLSHIHLETMPHTGSYSLGDSASNWVIFTWRHCLKLSHIHLEIVPRTWEQSFGNMSQTGIIFFMTELIESQSIWDISWNWTLMAFRVCPNLDHSTLFLLLPSCYNNWLLLALCLSQTYLTI